MLEAPAQTALVAPCGVALALLARGRGATLRAIDLASIAMAAHQHGRAAARAQEASCWIVAHEHPGQVAEGVLDGIVHGCNTGVAPVSHDTV
jgi:hypothetical protein